MLLHRHVCSCVLRKSGSIAHCAVLSAGHSLRAAVRLLVRRPLRRVVAGHHRHRAGRWRPPAGRDAPSQGPLQDPAVSPPEGAPSTQLRGSKQEDNQTLLSIMSGGQRQTEFDSRGDGREGKNNSGFSTPIDFFFFFSSYSDKFRKVGFRWRDLLNNHFEIFIVERNVWPYKINAAIPPVKIFAAGDAARLMIMRELAGCTQLTFCYQHNRAIISPLGGDMPF